jgi:hypothetical protein
MPQQPQRFALRRDRAHQHRIGIAQHRYEFNTRYMRGKNLGRSGKHKARDVTPWHHDRFVRSNPDIPAESGENAGAVRHQKDAEIVVTVGQQSAGPFGSHRRG